MEQPKTKPSPAAESLDPETMWKAVVNCDPRFDGLFYYGVKTTAIFCRPSCRSKTPLRKNVTFFPDTAEALSRGYRPCKRCRPDLQPPYDPGNEVIQQVTALFREEYTAPHTLKTVAARIGVSPFHLHRLFRKRTGMSMKTYLEQIRLNQAKRLLQDGRLNATETCYEVGFQSLSRFYSLFRQEYGCTPGEYRNQWMRKRK